MKTSENGKILMFPTTLGRFWHAFQTRNWKNLFQIAFWIPDTVDGENSHFFNTLSNSKCFFYTKIA